MKAKKREKRDARFSENTKSKPTLSDTYVIFDTQKKKKKKSGIYVIDREFTAIAIFGFKLATKIWKIESLILPVN